MTDTSAEALALYRSYRITDPDVVLALVDALEEARAALREAREFIAEECVRPEHEPAIPGSFADEAGKQLAQIDAALDGKAAP